MSFLNKNGGTPLGFLILLYTHHPCGVSPPHVDSLKVRSHFSGHTLSALDRDVLYVVGM